MHVSSAATGQYPFPPGVEGPASHPARPWELPPRKEMNVANVANGICSAQSCRRAVPACAAWRTCLGVTSVKRDTGLRPMLALTMGSVEQGRDRVLVLLPALCQVTPALCQVMPAFY